jgi:hypothetical protein
MLMIKKDDISDIKHKRNIPNADLNNYIQYDRIKFIIDGEGNEITQYSDEEKTIPIIETIALPENVPAKHVYFDNTVTGDYFENSPFKEVETQEEKNNIDAQIQDKLDREPKEAIEIMKAIFASFTGADLTRIKNCINNKYVFRVALDAYNYVLANETIDEARAEDLLIDTDVTTLKALLPKTGE